MSNFNSYIRKYRLNLLFAAWTESEYELVLLLRNLYFYKYINIELQHVKVHVFVLSHCYIKSNDYLNFVALMYYLKTTE